MEKKAKPGKVELSPVPETNGVYFGVVRGKRSVIYLQNRNRAKAEDRFRSITLREPRLKAAAHVAKAENLPLLVAIEVRVRGKFDGGWLATPEQYRKHQRHATLLL